jgi:hypothetical protein
LWVNTLIGVVLTAYVDESARRRRGEDVCFYVLAAVLIDDADLGSVRGALRQLRYGKSSMSHWRQELPSRWSVLAAAIADLPLQAIATVCLHDAEVKSERARRLCLGRLLVALQAAGADRAVLDSRRHEDDAELRLLQAWRRSGRSEAALRVDYLRSHMEPALWAADCVAGATAWWLNGDPVGCKHLGAVTEIVDVDAV